MFLPPLLLLSQFLSLISARVVYFDEVCDISGKRIYLELDETGFLKSRNTSTSQDPACKRCTLEIITCPSCIVNFKFT